MQYALGFKQKSGQQTACSRQLVCRRLKVHRAKGRKLKARWCGVENEYKEPRFFLFAACAEVILLYALRFLLLALSKKADSRQLTADSWCGGGD